MKAVAAGHCLVRTEEEIQRPGKTRDRANDRRQELIEDCGESQSITRCDHVKRADSRP